MSMVTQTAQGAVLSITSNVLAQALKAYKDKVGEMDGRDISDRDADIVCEDVF